jgi:hypothetical protein
MFTLGPVQRIKINIPSGMKVINPGQPKLGSVGDIKVAIAAVHGEDVSLSAQTMLERARAEGQSPIDSVSDLEEVLTRGLSVDGDYLVTGIILCDPSGGEYVLSLCRCDGRWIVDCDLLRVVPFLDGCRVLCLGK